MVQLQVLVQQCLETSIMACAQPDIPYDLWTYSYNLNNTEGPHFPGYHDPPWPSCVGYGFGDGGSNVVHNVMDGLSFALCLTATSNYSNTAGYAHTNIKPQQTYTIHVTIPWAHQQTPPQKHWIRSHYPDIYTAPHLTSSPSLAQAPPPAHVLDMDLGMMGVMLCTILWVGYYLL